MSDPTPEARRIFLEAIETGSPEERARFLDAACMAGSELRSRVEALLQAHDNAGRFLGGAATSAPTLEHSFAEGPGTAIGPYKLLEPIGEGGMGTVYRAEQTAPRRFGPCCGHRPSDSDRQST